jgi:2-hydroxychromene-2-carboxylate isomerase
MDGSELASVLDDVELKSALRAANDAAIATGVYGVPTFDAAGLLWWGDHQLEAAALYHRLRA